MATIQVETPNGVVYFQPNDDDYDKAIESFTRFIREIYNSGVRRGKDMVIEHNGTVGLYESENKEHFPASVCEVGFRVNSGFDGTELLKIMLRERG